MFYFDVYVVKKDGTNTCFKKNVFGQGTANLIVKFYNYRYRNQGYYFYVKGI